MSNTYGQQFDEALSCTTREEAEAWIQSEIVRYETEFHVPAEEARKTILTNIGYMAGYYSADTAKKIHSLFDAAHPILGKTWEKEPAALAVEALEAGKALAAK